MKEKLHVKQYLLNLQNSICKSIEAEDEKSKFQVDKWTRAEGGGGSSRIITNGRIFEKGGVNFSHVHGWKGSCVVVWRGLRFNSVLCERI